MKKYNPGSLIIILPVVILILHSCVSESCFEEITPFIRASFYKTGSDKAQIPDSLTVFGIGNESVKLYNKAKNVSVMELPLNASSATCGFVVKINTITDTLRFTYSNYSHLISKECGITFFHLLETYKVSGSTVDTIIIKNNNITTSHEENIRIFY
jgi:hypothetical protein